MEEITLSVNGRRHSLPQLPGETLASLLRDRLRLTGTKIGCGEAECGTCTVVIDGEAVLSCTYPAARANGKNIVTIEGLSAAGAGASQTPQGLHPLQEAFVGHGAVQCGFCIPGQIMTAYALLQRNATPTREEIRQALKDTLCRCAGYPSIEDAVLAASQAMSSGGPVSRPPMLTSVRAGTLVGRPHVRPDAVAKVNGSALYTDDLIFDGMLHARVKRAMVPHAILRGLSVSRARELPGVRAVLTASDIPGDHNHGLVVYDWPVMVGIGERIRYVGDALAIVAADSEDAAKSAVDLISAEFEHLPVITDPVQARNEDVPRLHETGNLLKHIKVRKGDMQRGFAESDVVLEHTFHTPIEEHAFLEPECSIAVPTPDGRLEIYVGSQIPYQDRTQVARVLGWPEERIRIVGQLMGGGFGGKEDIAGQIHAALLAQATGRPVKLLFDRHESLLVHPKRHATQIRVKIGAKRDGRLHAVETELYGDTGAYASLGDKVMTRATTHSAGPYDIPHVRADCYAMYTNNPPAGAFRGFGVTQSAFAVETMMDILAEHVGADPIELRAANSLRVGSTTNTGQVLTESVGLTECIDRVSEEMKRSAFENCGLARTELFKPHGPPAAPHLVHAWGFAAGYKNTGLGGGAPDKAGAEVELYDDGRLEVRSSSAEMGQGLVAVMQMVVAEELAVEPERVGVLVMDTDLTPDGGPTTASRQTYVTGNASRLAARALRQAIAAALAEKYDVPPQEIRFAGGRVRVDGRQLSYEEVAQDLKAVGRQARALYEYEAPETRPLGQGGDMHFAFSFAAQGAEVEVNTLTGETRVLRVIAANDVGTAINPVGLKGQIEGGVMMGIGTCLTEEYVVEGGAVITDHLARYRMPGILLTPEITPIVVEHPTRDGPYGAKGVGEICAIPTTPAITNAIYNAVGVRIDRLPVDQEMIARELLHRREAIEPAI
jgi:CO/xanthine dehydrogenase Mo-binding subunit/aerobic-type carbon monoxide dehydrogenase small subunit (CoxS/CutS family)